MSADKIADVSLEFVAAGTKEENRAKLLAEVERGDPETALAAALCAATYDAAEAVFNARVQVVHPSALCAGLIGGMLNSALGIWLNYVIAHMRTGLSVDEAREGFEMLAADLSRFAPAFAAPALASFEQAVAHERARGGGA